jgi:hypothetical protein
MKASERIRELIHDRLTSDQIGAFDEKTEAELKALRRIVDAIVTYLDEKEL